MTRNGDVNNHVAALHLQAKHQIDLDSATCIIYSTVYSQRLALEPWFTNLEQMPLNRSQHLPAPTKRLFDGLKQNLLRENDWTADNLTIDGSERTNDVTAQLTDDQQHRRLINQSDQ